MGGQKFQQQTNPASRFTVTGSLVLDRPVSVAADRRTPAMQSASSHRSSSEASRLPRRADSAASGSLHGSRNFSGSRGSSSSYSSERNTEFGAARSVHSLRSSSSSGALLQK